MLLPDTLFQFLIGRLKTVIIETIIERVEEVSIPHR